MNYYCHPPRLTSDSVIRTFTTLEPHRGLASRASTFEPRRGRASRRRDDRPSPPLINLCTRLALHLQGSGLAAAP
eukprot:scaffold46293_cov70-Phaeocystis_antarctica.AAC.10